MDERLRACAELVEPSYWSGSVMWGVAYTQFGCRSELFFMDLNKDINHVRWQALADRRDELEAAFGGELVFDDLPKNIGCRIEARLEGLRVTDQNRWPEVLEWMLDTQARLRAAVRSLGGVPKQVPEAE